MDENKIINQEEPKSNDELKEAIEEQMIKLRRQNMLIGSQAACSVVLQKINSVLSKPGKVSFRDYERLIKGLKEFCTTGVSRTINNDGTTSENVEQNEIIEGEVE